jgi:hypothetical protein
MKIVVCGGSGRVGRSVVRAMREAGHDVVIVGRGAGADVVWDACTLGPWASALEGADCVLNLAGKSVSCRYTKENLTEMLASRVDSTRVLGAAIAACTAPPRVWLQMSTATVYAHRFDASNDEDTGILGGHEPNVPAYWRFSVEIALAWERALADAPTPHTRKVALRTAMVMDNDDVDGTFTILSRLARLGLGGAVGSGAQYLSWIHARDFVRALVWILDHDGLAGPINIAAPEPLPQRTFMQTLRKALRVPFGLPATTSMVALGAFVLRTDPELLLKSRRVVPGRLLASGFRFEFPTWDEAALALAQA